MTIHTIQLLSGFTSNKKKFGLLIAVLDHDLIQI
jgi:hypothetical protein